MPMECAFRITTVGEASADLEGHELHRSCIKATIRVHANYWTILNARDYVNGRRQERASSTANWEHTQRKPKDLPLFRPQL